MKICFIGKYPPIEGGVSSCNYWLAKSLGEIGHKVFIVTNAKEAGFEYKEEIPIKETRLLEPRNVKVFYTSPLNSKFIPYYPPFIAVLAGMAIDLVKKEKIDVIYSNYLLPYGIAAYLTKLATGVAWFLDHAGSDITRLFAEPTLKPVFYEIFKKADLVVSSKQVYERFIVPGVIKKTSLAPAQKMHYASIADNNFSPKTKPADLSPYLSEFSKQLPVFTFLGKISELKKTFAFVKAASFLPKGKFYLIFVTEKGQNLIRLQNTVAQFGLSKYTAYLPFQPPWKIPSIINASTCIVAPESEEEPYLPSGTHISRIALEAMLCGRCAILGKQMAKKGYYSLLKEGVHYLQIDPQNIYSFTKVLKRIVENPSLACGVGKRARALLEKKILPLWRNSPATFAKVLSLAILKQEATE